MPGYNTYGFQTSYHGTNPYHSVSQTSYPPKELCNPGIHIKNILGFRAILHIAFTLIIHFHRSYPTVIKIKCIIKSPVNIGLFIFSNPSVVSRSSHCFCTPQFNCGDQIPNLGANDKNAETDFKLWRFLKEISVTAGLYSICSPSK